jgi:hypothetical protein
VSTQSLDIISHEAASASLLPARTQWSPDALWRWVGAALLVWAAWHLQIGRRPIVNAAGWPQFREFFAAAFRPDLNATTLTAALEWRPDHRCLRRAQRASEGGRGTG